MTRGSITQPTKMSPAKIGLIIIVVAVLMYFLYMYFHDKDEDEEEGGSGRQQSTPRVSGKYLSQADPVGGAGKWRAMTETPGQTISSRAPSNYSAGQASPPPAGGGAYLSF